MPEATALPTVDELFVKWLGLLDGGALTTATFVAGDYPELVDPLQRRINTFIADRAANVEDTFTAATERTVNESAPVLPDYTILGPLGAGGMGVVYRVRDNLDREWALKIARHDQLTEAGRERFQDEARAMARLDGHPNVAPVRHLGTTTAGQPYFVMPVYPANLTSRLAEYQADPVKAVELMAAVAEGVAHLHSRGFIHRDLKPHNILIDVNGRPAVSDFGLVKCLSDVSSESPMAPVVSGSGETKPSGARRSKTVAGAAMGTRAYMAPEQAAGLTHLANPRWDVWALGVILHELLTGERPQSSLSPEALLDPRAPGNPAPSEIKPELDPRLELIVQRCLTRKEEDRYADGGEVATVLQKWLGPRPRKSARTWQVAGLVLLLLIGLGLIWIVRLATVGTIPESQTDPIGSPGPINRDDWAAQLRARLQPGQEVEVVRNGEAPHWTEWQVGESDAFVRRWPTDSAWSIDTQKTAYAQLVPPDVLPPTYKVRARIRMNAGKKVFGTASVTVAGRRFDGPEGPIFSVVAAGVSIDAVIPIGLGAGWERAGRGATLALHLNAIEPNFGADSSVTALPIHYFDSPRPHRGADEADHVLVIDVANHIIRVQIDGQPAGNLDTADARDGLTQRPDAPRFDPAGALGFLVAEGSGSLVQLTIVCPG